MVRQGPQPPQALRHEWISAWLPIKFHQLNTWLFAGTGNAERNSALFAALGHHLKIEDGSAVNARPGSGDTTIHILCDHPDFHASLQVACEVIGLARAPQLENFKIDIGNRSLFELREWLRDVIGWFEGSNLQTRRFIALVKALVVAADVAGSALPRTGNNPRIWTEDVLGRVCTGNDLESVAVERLQGNSPRTFQDRIAQSSERVTFVNAGCGSGKTVAAYLWASRQAAGRKVFFCYPTTGTATEGYRDYIIPSEMRAESELLHSRSEVDLEGLLDTEAEDKLEKAMKIASLAAWDVPLVICTADTVLGLIQNNRKALFSFPSIGNGVFVFDEIHQYDDRLFASLIRFLTTFSGTATLLMTASLPKARLKAVEEALENTGAKLRVIPGPRDLENIKRYQLRGIVTEPPWDLIGQMLGERKKILWVANTVSRATTFAKKAQEQGMTRIYPYHSRYRYCDRLRKHNAVVDAFKAKNPGPVLAITTQVCEVSLDISADLIVSDLAPTPGLIQRLGRLNRRVTAESPGEACPAIFLEPETSLPYEKEDLKIAREWLQAVGRSPVSQADLAVAFEKLSQDAPVPTVESAWLDGGPFSKPAPLREAGVTIPVIRAEDYPACVDERGRPILKEITRQSIPMTLGPVAKEVSDWKRVGFAFVVPKSRLNYSEQWGAEWL
jgi:CRISPR-associated endonuclease/helicase Cas3